MYIYNNDNISNQITSALISAAKRGVQIKVIVDGIGTPNWDNAMTRQLEVANIQSKIYHPIPWHFTQWRRSTKIYSSILNQVSYLFANINKRNHRKICIIDSNVFVGSCNFSSSHLSRQNKGDGWHDMSILLSNVNSHELIYSFERIWGSISFRTRFKRAVHKTVVDPIFRLNDTFRQRHIYKKNMKFDLSNSQHRIWIMNSYFVPDQEILNLLIDARKRKIDVRLILPFKTDVFIISVISKTFYDELIKAGILVYEYTPRILHAKVLMIDNQVYIGSSNFNQRSLRHDLEVDVKVKSKTTIDAVHQIFLNDFADSKLISSDDVFKQSNISRLLGKLLLLIKYFL
jgi:cardiolipin synthase